MNQNDTVCLICAKHCRYQDWVVYDGVSGYCKCRECMNPKNNHSEPWKIQFPNNRPEQS